MFDLLNVDWQVTDEGVPVYRDGRHDERQEKNCQNAQDDVQKSQSVDTFYSVVFGTYQKGIEQVCDYPGEQEAGNRVLQGVAGNSQQA